MAECESSQGRKRQRRDTTPRSAVWEHFTRFTNDGGRDKARCKRCRSVLGAATKMARAAYGRTSGYAASVTDCTANCIQDQRCRLVLR
ncbi:unnamed protein product [Urochloa humidicola]